MRKRAGADNHHNDDKRDHSFAADDGDALHHGHALLILLQQEGEGTLTACPLLFVGLVSRFRFGGFRLFFVLANHRGDGLKFFPGLKIH